MKKYNSIVFFEYHPGGRKDFETKIEKSYKIITDLGYKFFELSGGRNKKGKYSLKQLNTIPDKHEIYVFKKEK